MSLAAVATLDSHLWSQYTTTDTSKAAINQALQTVCLFFFWTVVLKTRS
jgi:hypothetical protein